MVSEDDKSFIATTSKLGCFNTERRNTLPILPKPFIAIRAFIIILEKKKLYSFAELF